MGYSEFEVKKFIFFYSISKIVDVSLSLTNSLVTSIFIDIIHI